jgi:hypothetical protein
MIGLSLCVDCRGSATKIVYQLEEEDSPKYLLMSPEVEQVPASQLQKYFDRLLWRGDPAPNQEAWLQVDGKTFVVGEFAQYFDPSDRLHEVKYENALYKVLTAIGVIAQKSGLNTRKNWGCGWRCFSLGRSTLIKIGFQTSFQNS